MSTASLLDPRTLTGTWRLERIIVDHRNAEELRVEGIVDLTAQADRRIRWTESGTLHRRGAELAVSRTLFIEQRVIEQRADAWFVTFEDGSDFHPWEPGHEVEHPCAADLYVGRIDGSPERWTVEWRVTGPAKDYVMSGVLVPA